MENKLLLLLLLLLEIRGGKEKDGMGKGGKEKDGKGRKVRRRMEREGR